jgi:competence protein ComEC
VTVPRIKRLVPLLLLLTLAPLAILAGIFLRSPKATAPEQNRLRVMVINVGQGESSLIRTPGGGTIVIGAGPAETGTDVVAALEGADVRQIDLLILPYPFAEASGGVPELYESFEFKTVLEPGGGTINPYISADTTTGRLMREASDVQTVRAGSVYTLDSGRVKVEILAPQTIDGSRPATDDSLVVAVSYGQTRFLFAGGLGRKGERALLSRSPNLRANWLRVARSGSAEASSPEFLRLVRPEFAVISVGPNGDGFPAPDTLRRLRATGAKLYRTDQNGGQNITFWSDGREVTQGSGKP